MNCIKIKAPAKLNLSLDITGQREDGYHLLEMVMQTIHLYDQITLEKADEITLECDCPDIPCNGKNLAVKAAKAFFHATHLDGGVKITLQKRIPHGAGMGGGSSDAAAVLKGLNRLYHTPLSTKQLDKIGLKLGADVPFCLHGGTMLVTGIGENLLELQDMFPCWFVVAKPEQGLSTAEVYQAYDALEEQQMIRPKTNGVIQAIYEKDLEALSRSMANVLEYAAPLQEIAEIRQTMHQHGAYIAQMTGSGSAVFGIFEQEEDAKECAVSLSQTYQQVYVCKPCKR